MLRGDPTAFEPIWLEKPGGRHVSIVWPEGFTARFEPAAVLRDERGVAVARAGTLVTLGQVNDSSAAGTFADPYVATGLVFAGCYHYTP